MPTSPIITFNNNPITPKYGNGKKVVVKLPVSVNYAKGTILGELIGNNEVQSITIDATGGTFTITFSGQTTAALAFNASAAVVLAALEALSTIGAGNVAVQKVLNRWTLTHTNGTDGGTFGLRITRNGISRTVEGIAWNATAASIDTSLEALDIIGTGGVAVTGSDGGPYTLTFVATLGDVDVEVINDFTADGGVLEGGIVLAQNPAPVYLVTFQNDLGSENVAAVTTDAGSLTGGAGTAAVATVTAGSAGTVGTMKKVDLTATDGTQKPKAILPFQCRTDSNGKITYGDVDTGGEHGQLYDSVEVWYSGDFDTADLPDLTDAIIAAWPGARLVHGTVESGVLCVA